jgi:hypothetical protein
MDNVILQDIPFELDVAELKTMLHVKPGSSFEESAETLAHTAQTMARPRALYKIAFVEDRGDDFVVIDGATFASRVLRVNLDQAHRVFPYVVTCGTELEDWSNSLTDMLQHFTADTIKQMALTCAVQFLHEHLLERFGLSRLSSMSPGSLQDWPLQAQRPLFALLGNVQEAIGVCLTKTYIMTPIKSVSGIRFPTEESFESCQLCPREVCPNRRAFYDRGLYDRKFRLSTD